MTFLIDVVLSFFIGGLFIAGVILFTEKLGARIGATIAGMPFVSLVGLSFISITSGPEVTKQACLAMPIFGISALFYGFVYEKAIVLFKTKSRDFAASLTALLAWATVNLVLIAKVIPNINFVFVLVISFVGIVIFYLLFIHYPSVGAHRHPTTKEANLTRFFISGFIVAMSGIFAKFLGPTWGGLVASFPVTIAVGLYFLDKSQSDNFTKSFVKELPLAIVSALIFVSILYLTLTKMDTVFSFLISIIAAYAYAFIHLELRRKLFRKTTKIPV
jgi:uncharacterized membrane protein (GlpM family)